MHENIQEKKRKLFLYNQLYLVLENATTWDIKKY